MLFTKEQRKELTAIKGIGDTFVTRLEQMGLGNVEKLAQSSWEYIVEQGAEITGSTCYKNSPQALLVRGSRSYPKMFFLNL